MKDNITILCVDDEQNILNSLKRVLQNTGYNILTSTSGKDGLKVLQKEKIQIIITDYRMPGMNGVEFLKKARDISPKSMRIMLSGYSDIDATIYAINEGNIHKYITKPWDNHELKAIIEEVVKQYKQQQKDQNYTLSKKEKNREMNNIKQVLKLANFETIKALSKAIELKDKYTKGHCERVMKYGMKIVKQVDLEPDNVLEFKYACLLHDVGKIVISSDILTKRGPLNDDERKLIREHPINGALITSEIEYLSNVSRIILEHHERIDGNGYPYGKKGAELLLESKILSIADVYDALTSERAYRKAYAHEKALNIMINEKNKMFDEKLLDIFLKVID